MNRSRWAYLGLAVLLGGGLIAAFLGPRGPEEFPLAELVPADAVVYAGFADLRRFEELTSKVPGLWKEEDRKRFDQARPHLSGAIAFYVDPKGEWVGLARLTRAASLAADLEGDAAVFAQTPAALERFRARTGSLRDLPAFRRLKSRFFVNLEGRGTDYEAVGFDVAEGNPLVIRGRAAYRPDRYRMYIERYVQASHQAGAEEAGGAPVAVAMTDPTLRLWDLILEGLAPDDRDRVERECQVLRRDPLGGRDVRDFLSQLGPRWGVTAVPTAHAFPALVAWLDLPDDAARETLEKLLSRAAQDWVNMARSRGQAPQIEVEKKDGVRLLKFTWAASRRMGEAFTPAYTFAGNRLVVSTCASVLQAPWIPPGEAHQAAAVRVAPAVDLWRAMVPVLADGTFRSEADGMALARYLREYNPLAVAALSRKMPDPYEREKFLATRRAEFAAEALAEIAKGQKYRDELARREKSAADWAERLSGFERLAWTARFTGDGLAFELRAWARAK